METNKRIITSYLAKSTRYFSLIKKNNQYFVKEGFITYKLDLINYTCQCNTNFNLCPHLLFFFEQHFKCDLLLFKFFHKFKQFLTLDNTNQELLPLIKKSIGDDCGICTLTIKLTDDLHECQLCAKYCHQHCINRWIKTIKNTKHDKTCIYCHSVPYV